MITALWDSQSETNADRLRGDPERTFFKWITNTVGWTDLSDSWFQSVLVSRLWTSNKRKSRSSISFYSCFHPFVYCVYLDDLTDRWPLFSAFEWQKWHVGAVHTQAASLCTLIFVKLYSFFDSRLFQTYHSPIVISLTLVLNRHTIVDVYPCMCIHSHQ